MVKNTLKNTMSEVYNVTNNNATFKKNVYDFNSKLNTLNTSKNTNNMLRSKNNGNNNINLNTPSSNSSFSNSFEKKEQVSSFLNLLPYIIFFLLLVVCIFVIFRYKDKIREIFEKYFSQSPTNIEKEKELEKKLKDEKEKVSQMETQMEEKKEETKKGETKKEKTKKKSKSVENSLKQQYSESQIVKEDGYCFIGTDNQMRHCVDAYSGDVCTSGDIYRRMDDCLIPKLSSNNQQCYF